MDPSKVLVCALLYGDHHALHRRLIDSLREQLPPGATVHLWLNTVCQQTIDYIGKTCPPWNVTASTDNVPKYKVMQQLFAMYLVTDPKRFTWVNWYDDDTYTQKGWWEAISKFIDAAAEKPEICYIGQPWFVHHLPGQWEFIQQSTWFKGIPAAIIKGKPGVHFAQGAYWWLKTDLIRQINWPDHRLSHNGGDTLLGEAVRQQGFPVTKFDAFVRINQAKRRGLNEKPAGSTVDTRR